MSQLRVILRSPEIVALTHRAAEVLVGEERPGGATLADVAPTLDEVREALTSLDCVWDELFPAEKQRIAQTPCRAGGSL